MVHQGMRNDSMVVDELYIKRGGLAFEGFLCSSVYSVSGIANQGTTWNSV
jgi:hypothetical protein